MPENQKIEDRIQETGNRRQETIETRPYPNEHAARIKDPDLFKAGDKNWGSKDIATGIRIILGILKSTDKWETQAYRFKLAQFTAAEAKKWLKDHDVKYILFEPATNKKSQEIADGIEKRFLNIEDTELRLADDKPMIAGYAAKYGIFTDLGWFREKIKDGAFDEVLNNDVRCLKNHDPNLILGRTKNNTLRLISNSVGLKFENDIPDTTIGRDTREEIRRGDISGCSFAFTVAEQEWKYFEDKPSERTIVKIGLLFDVGPVTYPAYPDTTVAARSFDTAKKEILATEDTEDTEKKSDKSDKPDNSVKPDELTFEQKFEYEKNKRKAERLLNRLNIKQA